MAAASNFEQFMLELINSARMNPQADFARYIKSYDDLRSSNSDINSALRYFEVDGAVLKAQVKALEAVEPLAWNSDLNKAATAHSKLMIEKDEQSHQLPGEAGLGGRIQSAGYDYSSVGENVFAYTQSPVHGHGGFMVDWGFTDTGIQNPAGHRNSIMSTRYQEVGIGVVKDDDAGNSVGPYVVTQDFGMRASGAPEAILLGVAWNDRDNDRFYSLGEGSKGTKVSVGGSSDTTPGSGGYAIETSAGTKTVTFSGGGLDGAIKVKAAILAENAKIDLVDEKLLKSSVSLNLMSGAKDAQLYTRDNLDLTGNDRSNLLKGNAGKNKLSGNSGGDDLKGKGGADRLFGGWGKDKLDGGKGADVLTGGGKADTFVFRKGYGKDVIKDFEEDTDTIRLDDNLWGGGLGKQKMLERYGSVENGDVVLDFGKHELKIKDVSDIGMLVDDILIV